MGSSGYLDFLFKGYAGKLTTEQLTQLGFARDSVLQLQKVIDAFLDVAAFDLGLMQLAREPLDLNAFTAGQARDLEDWAEAEGRALSWKGASRGLTVMGDPNWLRVMVYEVVGNAIRVTPTGGKIELELWRRGDNAVLQVSDQGPGVPADRLRWIFRPLTQLRGLQPDALKGERGGLGLALAEHVARAHGGRLWAERAKRGLAVLAEFPLSVKKSSKAIRTQGGAR